MESLPDIRIRKVSQIFPHPNADKLEILRIDGWQTIASKESFKVNDDCVYVPLDYILPENLEKKIFGDSKLSRKGDGRIKSIKLRGSLSQGLAIHFDIIKDLYSYSDDYIDKLKNKISDWGEYLKIVKYEPPEKEVKQQQGQPQPAKKKLLNSNFKKYTKIPKYQDLVNYFNDECEVCVTEKCHGTSYRAGFLRSEAKTLWSKVKKLFGFLPEWQFVYGSHEVQLSNKLLEREDTNNVYAKMVKQLDLQNRLPKDIIIFGEIYGHKIQKNYEYGLKDSQGFVLFDAYVPSTKRWLNCFELTELNKELNLQMVPVLYKGKFNPEKIQKLASGPSVLYPAQPIREGIVIEKINNDGERNKIRLINNDYLLKSDTTDFH